MTGLIIIFLIVGSVLLWKRLQRMAKKDALKKLKNFNIEEQYIAADSKGAIAIDSENERVCILDHQSKAHYYKYENIYSIELLQSADKKVKGSVVGAIIGGAIGGAKGAVTGHVLGSKKTIKVKQVQLKIGVNNAQLPFHIISFLGSPTKSNTSAYKKAYKKATYWQEKFTVYIESGKRKIVQPTSSSETKSIGDELIKLNGLKNKGVLTEGEFVLQKEKLLAN